MFKKCIFLIVCLVMFVGCLGTVRATEITKVIVYVAKDGNDTNEGNKQSPFATINRAKEKVRQIKENSGQVDNDILVYIREGEYEITNMLSFGAADSGTDNAPITYRAYPNEKVTLVGGKNIMPSDFTAVTDTTVLERIIDTSARSKVMQVDLKQLGITDFGLMDYPGTYLLPWMNKLATPPELFFKGEPMTMARYPNNDYITITTIVNPGAMPGAWGITDTSDPSYVPPEKRNQNDGFVINYTDDRISKWTNADDIRLFGYWAWNWADQSVKPSKIDTINKTITSEMPSYFGVRENQRYYAFNLIEELDAAGEYYLDRDSGILYFYPPSDISNTSIKLSLLSDDLIYLNGASNIIIKDLDIESTRGRAIQIANGINNKIMNCNIKNTGDAAINFDGKNNGVIGCRIYNTNGGISVGGGNRQTLEKGGNYVENNDIEKFARIKKTYNSGIGLGGVGNRASYNKIHDAAHLAIGFSGNDNIIEYNEIYDVLKDTDDAGALYTGRNWTCRGNEIKYNYFHDLGSQANGGNGVHAIYYDDTFCGALAMGNIIENVTGNAFMVGGGRDNIMFNNIIINAGRSLYLDDRGVNLSETAEQYQTLNSVPYLQEPWKSRYPELANILNDEPGMPKGNVFKNNLVVNTGDMYLYPNALRETKVTNNYETKSDPGFYDMAGRNFLLKRNASVFERIKDFNVVPFTRMGTYTLRSEDRVKDALVLAVDSPLAILNNKITYIDSENDSVSPVIKDGSTLVPMRFIAEAFGAETQWDDTLRNVTIKIGEKTIIMGVCSYNILVNEKTVTLDTRAQIINGRIFVPIRAITEIIGKSVFWDDMGIVVISDNEKLFNPIADSNIITALYEKISIY